MKSPYAGPFCACFAPPVWTWKRSRPESHFSNPSANATPSAGPIASCWTFTFPGLTGLDVQRQLKTEEISIPIIMVTGNEEAGIQERVLAEGASAFFSKPLNDRTLLSAIASAVEKAGSATAVRGRSDGGPR